MRGSFNEDAGLNSLRQYLHVSHFFNCDVFAMESQQYMDCSPDASKFSNPELFDSCRKLYYEEVTYFLATVEINTAVCASSISAYLSLTSADFIICSVGSEVFKTYIAQKHAGLVVQQSIVLGFNICIYIAVADTGIVYKVIAIFDDATLSTLHGSFRVVTYPLVHSSDYHPVVPPSYFTAHQKAIRYSQHKFSNCINSHVMTSGPFPPVKVLKHDIQIFYSKTKGGVDGSTQARTFLRSSTIYLKWEQKLVKQSLKTIAVKSFIIWRIDTKKDLLQST